MGRTTKILTALLGLFWSGMALAVPPTLTFQGRLIDNGQPVESSSVVLTVTVKSPSPDSCVLFEETHPLNMTNSDGIFTVKIGSGSRTANDKSFSLTQVFSNTGNVINGLSCAGVVTSYTPLADDNRNLYVSFNDNGNIVAFSDPYVIQSVPYAIEAERLAGKASSDYLQVTTDTTQTKLNDIMASSPYAELLALLNGTSSKYMTSSATDGTSVPVLTSQPGTLSTGQMWYQSGSLKYYDGSNVKTLGTGETLDASNISSGTLDASRLPSSGATAGTYKSVTVDTYGRVTAGTNPTTLSGYGITDAVVKGGQAGALTLGTTDSNSLTLNTNNTAKMTILSGGNVGIGTTNPASLLSVAGGVTIGSSYASTAAPTDGLAVEGTALFGSTQAYLAAGTVTPSFQKNALSTGGSSFLFANWANDSSKSPTFYIAKSSGGAIGTHAALASGDRIGGLQFIASDGGTFQKSAAIQASVGGAISSGIAPGALQFYTTNSAGSYSERMRIDSSGNIGIGTTAPSELLSVASTSGAANIATWTTATPTSTYTSDSGTASAPSSYASLQLSSTGSLDDQFVGIRMRAYNSASGAQGAYIGGVTTNSTSKMPIVFGQRNTTTSFLERMRIDSSGNVGIGTTSPQATIDINGYARLKIYSGSPPVACSSTVDGAIAATSHYTTCICKGGASSWVLTADGTTSCTW